MAQLSLWPSVTDDSGDFTSGTIFNKALTDSFKAAVEDEVYSTNNPAAQAKNIIDEVIAARGSAVDLVSRLNVLTAADGTPLNGLVQRINTDLTSNQNVNAALTTLTQYSLTGNTLKSAGQALRYTAFGILGVNGNTKIIRFKFGATSIIFGSTTGSGLHWRMVVEIYRVDGTNQLLNGSLFLNSSAAENVVSGSPQPTETLSGAVVLGVSAQGTSTGDIIQKAQLIELLN